MSTGRPESTKFQRGWKAGRDDFRAGLPHLDKDTARQLYGEDWIQGYSQGYAAAKAAGSNSGPNDDDL